MKTLITGEDIKENCGLSPNFPAIDLKSCRAVEHYFFSKHLSIDIYKKLLAAVVDYTLTPEWDDATAYTIGQVVKRQNRAYKAVEANTNFRPPNSKWTEAPRLHVDGTTKEAICINTIWCDGFLAETLSWAVLVARLPFIFKKIETDGVGNTVNDKFVIAELKEFNVTQGGAQKMYELSLDNFKSWVKDNKCFLPPSVETDCGCGEKKEEFTYDNYLIG